MSVALTLSVPEQVEEKVGKMAGWAGWLDLFHFMAVADRGSLSHRFWWYPLLWS